MKIEGMNIVLPYSRKIWWFYYNSQIKVCQNFLLAYVRVVILCQTSKFKFTNILVIAILDSIAKFNSRQYFRLYSILCLCPQYNTLHIFTRIALHDNDTTTTTTPP